MPRHVQPSISLTAFSCPHCGAYTSQTWYDGYGKRKGKSDGTPFIPDQAFLDRIQNAEELGAEQKSSMTAWAERLLTGALFLEDKLFSLEARELANLRFSVCYVCDGVAVWIHDRPIYPAQQTGPKANEDLPADIKRDYEEARSIVAISPRGAAALLRLVIQKLCIHLGGQGKSIDADIAALVAKGLSTVVQQALDIVRVIGNESVHPGTIDLRDNRDTALQLFNLVNLIVEQMISTPKHVKALYESLPEAKKAAIAKRDGKS